MRLLILLLVLVGLAALAILVRAHVRRVRAFPPGPDALAPGGAKALAARLAAAPRISRRDLAIEFAPSVATSVEPLVHGRAYFPRMLEDIAAATSSVHLLIYGWKVGQIGTTFRDALIAKVKAGVPVRLYVDGLGSEVRLGSKALYRELVEGGLQVVLNEGVWPDMEGHLGGRRWLDWRFDDLLHMDHRKFMVVDGRIGYLGGTGIEDHFNDERFYDTMTRVEGPVVAQLQALFLASWRYQGGALPIEPGALDPLFPTLEAPAGGARTTLLMNVPGEGHHPISDATEQLLDAAQQRVHIVNPYITDHGILDRLIAAAGRGVEVLVIVPGKPTPPQPAAAMRANYERLIAAGIKLVKHPDMAHAKVTLVDDAVLIGGCNLDALSLFHNFEANFLFEDAGVAAGIERDVFEAFAAVSVPVVVPTAFGQRAWDWTMDLLAPLL